MSEPKTRKTRASVGAFLSAIESPERRKDARAVLALMYRYASGREGDWPVTGFSPRAKDLTLYVMPGFSAQGDLLKRLGRHSTGKSCLYIRRLADVDLVVLEQILRRGVERVRGRPG